MTYQQFENQLIQNLADKHGVPVETITVEYSEEFSIINIVMEMRKHAPLTNIYVPMVIT